MLEIIFHFKISVIDLANTHTTHTHTHIYISSWSMNQTSRTMHSSSSTHLFDELNFQLKFDSFGS